MKLFCSALTLRCIKLCVLHVAEATAAEVPAVCEMVELWR